MLTKQSFGYHYDSLKEQVEKGLVFFSREEKPCHFGQICSEQMHLLHLLERMGYVEVDWDSRIEEEGPQRGVPGLVRPVFSNKRFYLKVRKLSDLP